MQQSAKRNPHLFTWHDPHVMPMSCWRSGSASVSDAEGRGFNSRTGYITQEFPRQLNLWSNVWSWTDIFCGVVQYHNHQRSWPAVNALGTGSTYCVPHHSCLDWFLFPRNLFVRSDPSWSTLPTIVLSARQHYRSMNSIESPEAGWTSLVFPEEKFSSLWHFSVFNKKQTYPKMWGVTLEISRGCWSITFDWHFDELKWLFDVLCGSNIYRITWSEVRQSANKAIIPEIFIREEKVGTATCGILRVKVHFLSVLVIQFSINLSEWLNEKPRYYLVLNCSR